MNFSVFERRAREIFEQIPGQYRQGISGLIVHREKTAHPHIADYVTLGECVTDPAAAAFAISGAEIRSQVHLYHGSFADLARRDPDFDWEAELRETIFHEIQHDLEERAGIDPLEDLDRAEEQNERRRAGLSFDPFFYRAGENPGPGEYWLGNDVFLEIELPRRKVEKMRTLHGGTMPLLWEQEKLEVALPPAPIPSVQFLPIEGGWEDEDGNGGDLFVVLLLKRGLFA